MTWTRRAVVAALGGTALGCLSGAEPTPPEPPGPEGEPATLFRPGTARKTRQRLVDVPDWFRDAPGLFNPDERTAGATLLMYGDGKASALVRDITHFRQLPELHAKGRQLGTDVLYIVGFYEPAAGAKPDEACWNKGDYVPRADFGGPEAFREGIAAVHRAGGRVILYVEPFVLHKESQVGKRHGQAWAIKDADGTAPEEPYPRDWKICPAVEAFQDHLVAVAERLVGDYGADGLHLDSFGFQDGWKCHDRSHGHPEGDPEVFAAGTRTLTARLLKALRGKKRDAVLLMEGPKQRPLFEWVAASQDWGINTLVDRWAWNEAGRVPLLTSGWSLDDMHQIVAMGHRFSLSDWWLSAPAGPSAEAWLAKHLPAAIPDKRDERQRRFYAETFFRRTHQWRNAGIVLGKPVPALDDVVARRGEGMEDFRSHAGLVRRLEAVRAVAPRIDAALAGASELPSPAAHVRKLMQARAALAPSLRDADVTVLDGPEHTLGYRFEGPNGVVLTAVNVGPDAAEVSLEAPAGRYREHVEGTDTPASAGRVTIEVPPHAVRLLGRV